MKAYQERVKQEYDELIERLEKLVDFMSTETFGTLSEAEQKLLGQQGYHMTQYALVLFERLNMWE
jgi:hypothetical protein